MSRVIANASMSLDGYIAKDDNTIGGLFDWLQNGDVVIPTASEGITLHLNQRSVGYWKRWTSSLGVLICGRTLFDFTVGWGGRHTLDVPVVVVTHEVPTDWVNAHPDAPFFFVTAGVAAAVDNARELAGERTVAVAAGTIAGQCLELGLCLRRASPWPRCRFSRVRQREWRVAAGAGHVRRRPVLGRRGPRHVPTCERHRWTGARGLRPPAVPRATTGRRLVQA